MNPLQETPVQNVTPTQVAINCRKGRIKKRFWFFHTMRFYRLFVQSLWASFNFGFQIFLLVSFQIVLSPIQNEITFSLWPSATETPGSDTIILVLHSKTAAHSLHHEVAPTHRMKQWTNSPPLPLPSPPAFYSGTPNFKYILREKEKKKKEHNQIYKGSSDTIL